MLMQGEDGIPKILGTEGIGRLMNLIEHQSPEVNAHLCRSDIMCAWLWQTSPSTSMAKKK